jgi:HK97 gp10 family phage protein
MADSVTVEIAGLDGLLRDLKAFPSSIQKRVLKGAAATGASVLRKEAVTRAPISTGKLEEGHPPPGTLKKAIYQVRLNQECTPTREVFKVGVRRGKRTKKNGTAYVDAYYAKWVEFGHYARVPHELTKSAKAAGRALGVAKWVAPHPFMRPAIAAKQADALRAMQEYIRDQMSLATAALQFLHAA